MPLPSLWCFKLYLSDGDPIPLTEPGRIKKGDGRSRRPCFVSHFGMPMKQSGISED